MLGTTTDELTQFTSLSSQINLKLKTIVIVVSFWCANDGLVGLKVGVSSEK
eukprot:m.259194 g.259194  ORF g.259194 m.259194 type:complete len:51 (+) comp37676_c0_seq1:1745-1897(+)